MKTLISPDQLVVATDLTDLGQLLPHARAQAHGSGACVTFVHSVQFVPSELGGHIDAESIAAARSEAWTYLSGAAEQLRNEGITCSVVVTQGTPAPAILEEVQRRGAARLLIGAHRHGNTGQTIIGTTANALLLASNVPIFVVPENANDPARAWPRRILHPTSLSQSSRTVGVFAVALASTYGVDLTLFHVVSESAMHGSYVRELFSARNRELNELVSSNAGASAVHTVVTAGETVAELLRMADEVEADWMIMAIEHDHPWWSMSNSAAYQVVAESRVPVLIVRDRMIAPAEEVEQGARFESVQQL